MVKKIKSKKFQINLSNRLYYSLIAFGVLFILGIGIFVYASASSVPNPGHIADTIWINISGTEKTLQSAINDGSLISSSSATTSCPTGYGWERIGDQMICVLGNWEMTCDCYWMSPYSGEGGNYYINGRFEARHSENLYESRIKYCNVGWYASYSSELYDCNTDWSTSEKTCNVGSFGLCGVSLSAINNIWTLKGNSSGFGYGTCTCSIPYNATETEGWIPSPSSCGDGICNNGEVCDYCSDCGSCGG